MAKNGKPGNGRIGIIKGRSQFENKAAGKKWTLRDIKTGLIKNVKADGKKFKNVRREK